MEVYSKLEIDQKLEHINSRLGDLEAKRGRVCKSDYKKTV